MKEKTNRIISLKESYDNYQIFDNNIILSALIALISTLSLIYKVRLNPYLVSNYSIQLLLIIASIGYLYAHYNSKVIKRENIKDTFDKLRIDMISSIDTQFNYEFCNHNQKCKCKEQYIKYMKDKYDIDLIFK